MTPLLGFTPDVDPATPGAITDCTQLVPTLKGMKAAPSAASISNLGALPAECRGAAVLQKTSGTRKTYAGTQTRIFELSSSTWSTASGTYTGSSENRWCFAQFGDISLATNDSDAIQYATATTFTAIPGAPKARILVSTKDYVVALNTQDATAASTFGDSPDRWWCAAFQDPTSWTINATTQATSGRLIGGGGEITAGKAFGDGLVAYKAREMFLGIPVAPDPAIFQFDRIPGDQGCVGPEAVDDIGGAHIFVGDDNIWMYDGSRPFSIANDRVRQWFFDNLSSSLRYRTIVVYERANERVWFFYPSTAATGNPDSALVYHLASKKWGRANRTIQAAFGYVSGGITWNTFDTIGATWDSLPSIPWDSQSLQSSGRALGIFDASNNLKTMTGAAENSGLTTGDFGADDYATFVSRIRARFQTEPTSATVSGFLKTGAGTALTSAGSGTLAASKFDIRQSGKWHRFAFSFVGDMEISAVASEARKAGGR